MIISLYAGILALIYIGLSGYTIKGRFKNKVSLGDNNIPDMQKRIRVHGNFGEYVPFALFLLFLMEVVEVNATLLHILGVVLILSRIAHIIGVLGKDGASLGRAAGTLGTFLVIIIAALYNIVYYLL